MKKTKLAIIGSVGIPANYGGFETLTEHLVEELSDVYDMEVYCSGKRWKKEERKTHYKGAKLTYIPLDANGIQSIPYDSISILKALFTSDVLLILGVAGAWLLPFVRLFTKKKIVISIDGIEWKRNKWNWIAKKYLYWAEYLAVKFSHIDISDNEAIQDYTAQRYGTLSRIVEYGGDHTLHVEKTEEDTVEYPFLKRDYAFKVCRIEPENNVHVILEAFHRNAVYPLVIVGNWNNSAYGKQLKEQYQDCLNIHLLDPIYNQRKLDVLRGNASLYVHGHTAGGTNPSLVEAMYLGLPILSCGVSYNKVTTENKAYYFTDREDIQKFLRQINNKPLISNGKILKAIAEKRYTWQGIAKKYQLLVEEALAVKTKRDVVSTYTKVNYEDLLENGNAHLFQQSRKF